MPRPEVERFLAQHRIHGLRKRLEARIAQHRELKFSVPIYKSGVGEEIEPIVDDLIKRAQQTLLFESAPLEHLLRLHFAAVTEMVDQQVAHLPAVAHFLGHDAAERLAVMFAGRIREKAALLFDRRKLRIALVYDQIHQAVADSLIWNLQHALPFRTAFEGAEFDFV